MEVKPGFRDLEKVSLSPELRWPFQGRGSTVEWNGLLISFVCFVPMRPLLLFKHNGFTMNIQLQRASYYMSPFNCHNDEPERAQLNG